MKRAIGLIARTHANVVADVAKKATTRTRSMMVDVLTSDALVERPAPGAAPTAFRIWAAGENVADDGSIFFTPRSADLLMSEQASRARRYSVDFDHLSIMGDRPATAGRAAGWHSIAVRPDAMGGPELWAVDVEWCADVKAGLEQDPPLWRYFSPAFQTDQSGEVVSYINLAVCINPLTHGLPALAANTAARAARKTAMKPEECAAMLAAMAEATDDPAKKEAFAMATAALAPPAAEGDDDEPKKDAEGEEPEAKAEGDDDEPKKDAKAAKAAEGDSGDDDKPEAKSRAAANVAAENVTMKKRLDALEIAALIDKRTDLSESVRAWCQSEDPAVVKRFLGRVSRVNAVQRNAKTVQTGKGPELLDGDERAAIDAGMGIRRAAAKGPERLPDGRFVLHTMRPSEFRASVQKGQA